MATNEITIIAKNQTVSDIDLPQLAVTVPGSGQTTLTDFNEIFEIKANDNLCDQITSGNIILNDGATDFDSTGSLNLIRPTVSFENVARTVEDLLDDPNEGIVTTFTGTFTTIKNNFSASVNPVSGDDSSEGYVPGSHWINKISGNEFVLITGTVGDAQWKTTTSASAAVIDFSKLVLETDGAIVYTGDGDPVLIS